jgi:regulatory protein YycI of two-component signal transduction system YycFG
VEILREMACESNGYVVAGNKYVQNSEIQEQYYSTIMAALSKLYNLMIQSEDFEQRRPVKRDVFGYHSCLPANTISHLSPFLRVTVENEVTALAAKFTITCKTFLRTISCPAEHPIVLMIDD